MAKNNSTYSFKLKIQIWSSIWCLKEVQAKGFFLSYNWKTAITESELEEKSWSPTRGPFQNDQPIVILLTQGFELLGCLLLESYYESLISSQIQTTLPTLIMIYIYAILVWSKYHKVCWRRAGLAREKITPKSILSWRFFPKGKLL